MMGAVRFIFLFIYLFFLASRQSSCQAASVRWDVCLNSLGFKGGGSWRAGGWGEEEKKKSLANCAVESSSLFPRTL